MRFIAQLRIFAWCCAVIAGISIGWFARGYRCETEFLQKADRFYKGVLEVKSRCNRISQERRDDWYAFLETGCECH